MGRRGTRTKSFCPCTSLLLLPWWMSEIQRQCDEKCGNIERQCCGFKDEKCRRLEGRHQKILLKSKSPLTLSSSQKGCTIEMSSLASGSLQFGRSVGLEIRIIFIIDLSIYPGTGETRQTTLYGQESGYCYLIKCKN